MEPARQERNQATMVQVRIEPVGPPHLPAIQELAADPAIGALSNVPSPYPPDGAMQFLQRANEGRQNQTLYAFAVVAEEGPCVGVCSLMGVSLAGTAELGYWIGKPYWGQGLATQAGHLVLTYAFQSLNLHLVKAACLQRNMASARVLEKLGFRLNSVRPILFPKTGQQESACFFTLTKVEWLARRSGQGGALPA